MIGTVMLSAMMIHVRVVKKRRDQENDPTQRIPSDPKPLELILGKVNQFVDKHRAPHVEQNANDEGQPHRGPQPSRTSRQPRGQKVHCVEREMPAGDRQ